MYNKFFDILDSISILHDSYVVFNDFIIMSAIAISNSVNFNQDKEDEYLSIVKKYSKEELDLFVKLLAELVNIYQDIEKRNDIQDVLGEIFNKLNIANKVKGQFFTPYHISYLVAKISGFKKNKKGYYELYEPTCRCRRNDFSLYS